jgi:nitrogen regulatory protein PII
MKFKLLAAFVNPDITDKVVKVAKEAGATGDVIIQAKGCGMEAATFLGMFIQNKTNVVLLVVEEHLSDKIMASVTEACNLEEPGNGIMIALSIDRVSGLSKQIKKIRENLSYEQL